MRFTVAVLFLPALAAACGHSSGSTSAPTPNPYAPSSSNASSAAAVGTPVEGTTWMIVDIKGTAVTADDTTRAPSLLLQKDGNRMSGSSGCNRMTGIYTLSGDQLKFGAIAGTRMMCNSGMEEEGQLLATLSGVTRYHIAGNTLHLYAGDALVVTAKVRGSS